MQFDAISQCTALDKQAFQTFYRENLGPIYRFVYSKVRNREEAEDLTSQIFMKAVRNLDCQRTPQSTRNWLFQIARTTLADYWRVYYRKSASSLDELLEAGWEGPAEDETGVGGQLETHEDIAEATKLILHALPERFREVLTCRFLLGLSIRETAERLDLTEGNVKTLQFRALKRAAEFATSEGQVFE